MTSHRASAALLSYKDEASAASKRIFFKNCKSDIFLGVKAEVVRKLAKEFFNLQFFDIHILMQSDVHEERSLAHAVLCLRYRKAHETEKKEIFDFYLKNRHYIRDWDGVDDSAPYIVGHYLLDKEKELLYALALSTSIWDRRIAIVSTWWFIRHHHFGDTLHLAEVLLQDKEDLIHKGVGWMLREVGKKDMTSLTHFLDKHCLSMPRTMLRYAIEKFPPETRKKYLAAK